MDTGRTRVHQTSRDGTSRVLDNCTQDNNRRSVYILLHEDYFKGNLSKCCKHIREYLKKQSAEKGAPVYDTHIGGAEALTESNQSQNLRISGDVSTITTDPSPEDNLGELCRNLR